ncbi:hypothetical protein EV426DRAFT_720268 [Tirmania nivea]|nr:hypothetical protein EV426DRAFT_720268 [Tirmania nivea]
MHPHIAWLTSPKKWRRGPPQESSTSLPPSASPPLHPFPRAQPPDDTHKLPLINTVTMHSGPCTIKVQSVSCSCTTGIFDPPLIGGTLIETAQTLCHSCRHSFMLHEGFNSWADAQQKYQLQQQQLMSSLTTVSTSGGQLQQNLPPETAGVGTSADDFDPAYQAPTFTAAVAASFGPQFCARENTVRMLAEKVDEMRVVHIRGTPGSGKSALLRLLQLYMRRQNRQVVRLCHWPLKSEMEQIGGWNTYLIKKCQIPKEVLDIFMAPVVVLIDEAQSTYWDTDFWNDGLKAAIDRKNGMTFVLASSYGSPSGSQLVANVPPHVGYHLTPVQFAEAHMVGLKPDERGGTLGVFFSETEFDDLLSTDPSMKLGEDVKELIYRLTGGHSGATVDVLSYVKRSPEVRQLLNTTTIELSIVDQLFIDYPRLCAMIEQSPFRIGLPPSKHLKQSRIGDLLAQGTISEALTADMTAVDAETLNLCYVNGWLQAESNGDTVFYVFPTILHRWFCYYHLIPKQPPSNFPYMNLQDLAFAVLRAFSSTNLQSYWKGIGTGGIRKNPDALYHAEFFRCIHKLTNGGVIASLESSHSQNGLKCIDFMVTGKAWGIEALRKGDGVMGHYGRFQVGGAYAKFNLEQFILLDFRTSKPTVPQPECQHTFHVVFSEGNTKGFIYDAASLSLVQAYRLLT